MKKGISILLILCMLAAFPVTAAASTDYCGLSYVNITINGIKVANTGDTYELSNGDNVPFSLLYNGTTYLPMRKLAELLGKEVGWDPVGYVASITDTTGSAIDLVPVFSQGKKEELKNIETSRNQVNIVVNGTRVASAGESYTLDNGDTVPYSLLYRGTTYLPLRKIAEILNKQVDWDQDTKTAMISEKGPSPVIPAEKYDDMKNLSDFGKVYKVDVSDEAVYGSLKCFTYYCGDKTDEYVESYKKLILRSGYKEQAAESGQYELYDQSYTVYLDSSETYVVGVAVTEVASADASKAKAVSIMLGKKNPEYKEEA